MFKKINSNDIVTTNGTIVETIATSGPLIMSALNRRVENHYYFSSSGPGSTPSSGTAPYFITMLDAKPASPNPSKLFTVAYGIHSSAVGYASASDASHRSKTYRLYAQALLGNANNIFTIDGVPETRLYFLSLARNQFKKAIVPKTVLFSILSTNNDQMPSTNPSRTFFDIADNNIITLRGGRAGNLKTIQTINGNAYTATSSSAGMVFYDHGTIIARPGMCALTTSVNSYSGSLDFNACEITGGATMLHGVANKIAGIDFQCYNEPQVTFFKCVAEQEEFNYSSNPTFTDRTGQIVQTSGSINNQNFKPTTYITTIALCNNLGEVLAVAKATQPIKKNFDTKLEINVRLIQ